MPLRYPGSGSPAALPGAWAPAPDEGSGPRWPTPMGPPQPRFLGGGRLARNLQEVTDDPAALDAGGFWAVHAGFEGELTLARFADVRTDVAVGTVQWHGPRVSEWRSSLDRAQYLAAVETIRERIAAGEVYQANLCRVLSVPVPPGTEPSILALFAELERGNPSSHAAMLHLPEQGIAIASASPELFLRRTGDMVESGPIKGTARRESELLAKDRAENVMIVDLVRNDLGRVCEPGSVEVPALCALQRHPTFVHLVSTVRGRLRADADWADLLAATFPPGSVSGAPKLAALELIRELEPVPRGPYCGAIGWVDADAGTAELAVGIRTFWIADGELRFGTGAGITWGSDPAAEWAETELKAARLLALAEGRSRRGARLA